MELILTNPTERELIRMRQAAQSDWITMKNAERRAGRKEGREEGIEIGQDKTIIDMVFRIAGFGYKHSEIAKLVGIPESRVRAILAGEA